eukprot:TRINITY_DN1710_c0_g2_i5.p1 TRINITY_DN1710_c0_g2~~TRINITY_DN1710_c0_g2_i5.p1  ORF type:complete len:1587 (-),score=603.11 TRINITY_DN1710_c0_g2_i5:171-4931(-)
MASVVKEGFLKKEGASWHSWKSRWFVLTSDGLLKYFKSQKDTKPAGTIDLKGSYTFLPQRKTSFGTTIKNLFSVFAPESWSGSSQKQSNRTYFLIGKDEQDLKSWRDAITSVAAAVTKLRILVLGATGNIGEPLTNLLLKHEGLIVRAATRNPSKASYLKQQGAEVVEWDYNQPSTLAAALAGVQRVLFLNTISQSTVDEAKQLLDAIKAAKTVKLLVKIGGIGADQPDFILGQIHTQIEKMIKDSGIPFVFLRPNSFYQNAALFYGAAIKAGSNMYGAFGDKAKVSYVDCRDIAAVAAEALTKDHLTGKTIDISGPTPLDHHDIAAILSKHVGRKIEYINLPDATWVENMKGFGMSEGAAFTLLNLFKEYQAGRHADTKSPGEVEKIIGRKLFTFSDYVQDEISKFSDQVETVLVIGASGNVGTPLVRLLLQKKSIKVRAASRDPSKLFKLKEEGAEVVEWDLKKPETLTAALTGISRVFFIGPFSLKMAEESTFILNQIFKLKNLKHIVKLSAYRVEEPGFELGAIHAQLDDLVKKSGIPYTILRPNSFFQNMENFFGGAIKNGSDIYSAFGDKAKLSYVDCRDVAAVAAQVLTSDEYFGKVIDISGPESIDHHQMAATLSKYIGRDLKYVNVSDEQYLNAMRGYGFEDEMVKLMLGLYKEYQAGRHVDTKSPGEVEKIIGRKLFTFDDYVRENSDQFRNVDTILIIGATGNIGKPLVQLLLKKPGVIVRAASRDPSKLFKLKEAGAEVVEWDLKKPETLKTALAGISKVFFVPPFNATFSEDSKKILDEIFKLKNLKLIVKLSVFGTEHETYQIGKMHSEIDEIIRKSGRNFAILRPNSFFQNIKTFFAESIKNGNDIHSAFGDKAKLSYVDCRDVAAVAAEVLTRDEFGGKVIDISGPESIDHHQMAATLSKYIGRDLKYVNISDEQYLNTMMGFGMSKSAVEGILDLFKEYQSGRHVDLKSQVEVEKILKRKLISFDQYCQDFGWQFSSPADVILVMGATGQVGKPVVQRLVLKDNVIVRAATRNPEKSNDLRHMGAEPVLFDWKNPESMDQALKGVKKVFWIQALSGSEVEEATSILSAITRAGVKHIVKLSGGALEHQDFIVGQVHATIEEMIKKAGIGLTSLRPNFFSQNIGALFGSSIQAGNAFYGMYGDAAKLSYIDTRDVADVGVEVLMRSDEYIGKVCDVHGPHQMTHHDVAAVVSKVIGRDIKYINLTDEQWRTAMRGYGMHEGIIHALADLQRNVSLDRFAGSQSNEWEKLIGRRFITLEETLRDDIHKFIPGYQKLRIVVSGANGTIASRIAKSLLLYHGDKVDVITAVRSEDKATAFQELGSKIAIIDVSKPDTLDAALKGADRLLILPPFSEEMLPISKAWTDAAKRSNIKFVVKIGGFASNFRATIMAEWHDDGEKYIDASGLDYCFVRPMFMMTNMLIQLPNILSNGHLYLRFGQSKVNLLDPRDNGDLAAAILAAYDTTPYKNRTIEVLGTETYTPFEMAQTISRFVHRDVTCIDLTEQQEMESLLATGMPEIMARGLVQLASLFRVGVANQRNGVLEEILRRKSYTFGQFLRHHIVSTEKQKMSF